MDFLELSKAKSSERNVDSTRPVEEEKPSKILEAGKSAPTAGNHRPRHVYVPKGEIR
ncbi:nitroreductase family protein [Pyramidobacter sp.]|uniref:nitroreductase family protein n=1 Tax=Pyramidobacter sp. TaxID=1943581 RepID=UPI0039C64C17